GHIKIQVAAPFSSATPLDGTLEYYGPFLQIDKQKTVGATACAGCANVVCVSLDNIDIFYADDTHVNLTNTLNGNNIAWQGALVGTLCPAATPAKAKTWGELKSLYR